MTCIVGIAKDGKVYMGGDRAASGGQSHQVLPQTKVFFVGPEKKFIIGCTTSFRMIDILKYSFNPPKHKRGISDDEYMRTKFIAKIRKTFEANGYDRGNFLVGYNGSLYEVQNDFSVLACPKQGNSVGCGEFAARGSLWTTHFIGDISPKKSIKLALKAAAEVNTGVRGPFDILVLK